LLLNLPSKATQIVRSEKFRNNTKTTQIDCTLLQRKLLDFTKIDSILFCRAAKDFEFTRKVTQIDCCLAAAQ
jgi:phage gp36-like protein